MKVLIVSNGFPPSGQWGTEYYTHQLATGLAARGNDVSVLCPKRDGSQPRYTLEESERYGIDLYELHNAGDDRKAFRDSYRNEPIEQAFDDLLQRLEPDVVHFTHFLWGLSLRLPRIAHARGIGTIVTLTDYGLLCHRGQFFDWKLDNCGGPTSAADCARCIREPGPYDASLVSTLAKRWAARSLALAGGLGVVVNPDDVHEREQEVEAAMAAVDFWIAPTENIAEVFRAHGVAPDRITQLCYGVDEALYRDAPRDTDPARFRFGFLGQFMPHKGLHTLLEAVEIMLTRLPESLEDWDVHLFGNMVGGRHTRYLHSIWKDELAERVRFRGPFEPLEAPRVMATLDAAVMPSEWDENAPLTVLQARAAGIPVVATDVPGIREVLTDDEHGTLVAPGDPNALADAMRGMLLARAERPDQPTPVIPLRDHLQRVLAIYATAMDEPLPQLFPDQRVAARS